MKSNEAEETDDHTDVKVEAVLHNEAAEPPRKGLRQGMAVPAADGDGKTVGAIPMKPSSEQPQRTGKGLRGRYLPK